MGCYQLQPVLFFCTASCMQLLSSQKQEALQAMHAVSSDSRLISVRRNATGTCHRVLEHASPAEGLHSSTGCKLMLLGGSAAR
jgi:hypothetical protein